MSIEVRELIKIYDGHRVLDQMSFEINAGKIVGFLGPNGAGKSTTMKILTGSVPSSDGSVFIDGVPLSEDMYALKKRMGYLPEHNPLYLDMYVKEILHHEAGLHKLKNKKQRVAEVIKLTGLQTEQQKKVGQLSKGYRQRVGLAMAIIHDPAILILDEPTSGLDPNQILEIRSLIQSLAFNKTVLMSTHLMQEVEAICDEVIILHKGKIKDQFLLTQVVERYPNKSIEQIFVELTQ